MTTMRRDETKTANAPEALSDAALDAVAGGVEVHCVRVITQNDAIGTRDYSIDAIQANTSTLKSG